MLVPALDSFLLRYSRLFCLTGSQLLNVDPDNFTVTNTWSLPGDFVDFEPSVANDTEFTLTMVSGRSNEVRIMSGNICDTAFACLLHVF